MIGSLLKELPQIPETEVPELAEDFSFETASDDSLVAALPVVQKIVNRKTIFSWHLDASDLVQGIVLRLLSWRKKNQAKSEEMSSEEWQSFAARTTYNEINRHYKCNPNLIESPLESVTDVVAQNTLEGQSEAEFYSLARHFWQQICNLTLRQRQALLLGSQKLIINFLQAGITDEELAENLNLTLDKWEEVKERLPLKLYQIAELLKEAGHQNSVESIARSIKKARYEARAKMRRVTDK